MVSEENKLFGFFTSRDISEAHQCCRWRYWVSKEMMKKEKTDKRKSSIIQHLFAICTGMEKIYRLFLLGGGERENNLIQEIPRQTKTELPKWRRDPQGDVLGTSLRIMTLLCPTSECASVFVPLQVHTPSSPGYTWFGTWQKKTKRASAVCQKLLLEIKYICIIVMYEWQASLFDNDNLLKEQKTVFGRKTGVRNKNQLSKNLPVVENITCWPFCVKMSECCIFIVFPAIVWFSMRIKMGITTT